MSRSLILAPVCRAGCAGRRLTRTLGAEAVSLLILLCLMSGPAPAVDSPISEIDALGQKVTLTGPASRIVSLAPSNTEILFALGVGGAVVGVTEHCDFPPDATRRPRVGGFARSSLEKIVSLEPDLVLAARFNALDLLEGLRDLGIPVFWNITSSDPGPDGWMKVHEAFGRWVERFPEVSSIYTHGVPLYRFMQDGAITIPDEIWKPLEASNVFTEVLIPILMGGVWDFPYVEVQGLIREYHERLGPSKLIWGSDMPNVERHCTYMQCLDYLREYCDFISPNDMDAICGGNLAAMFRA